MNYDKRFWKTAAVRRMFDRNHINAATAATLLQSRARMTKQLAQAVVELWEYAKSAPRYAS